MEQENFSPDELFAFGESAEKAGDFEKAAQFYEQAANLNHVEAMLKLSELKLKMSAPQIPDEDSYQRGKKAYQDKDYAAAVKYYEQAAKSGNVKAMIRLGQIYELENFSFMGVKLSENKFFDERKAFAWYMKAAEAGNAYAMNAVGYMYSVGIGVEKNPALGDEWIFKAAENGDADAMYNVAIREENPAKSLEWLKRAAEYGSYDAMSRIGEMYEYGLGVEKNPVEAYRWYERAVHDWDSSDKFNYYSKSLSKREELGDAEIMLELAKIYSLDTNDDALYIKAADAGSDEARDYVAQMEIEELERHFSGTRKLHRPVIHLPKITLDSEKIPITKLLALAKKAEKAGEMYDAFELYMKAAEAGDGFAMFKVGDFYSSRKNDVEAFKWHMKSAETGKSYAMSEIAAMYLKGAGVEKNEAEGVRWLKKAAALKNPNAQAMLARMYELGIIVAQDINEALKWYVEAANSGETHAQERLNALFGNKFQK